MANSRIKGVSQISSEIQKQLKYYARDVAEKVEIAQIETATTLKKDVEFDSPERRPRYKSGWRIKKAPKKLILHNATDYQLTHLLEHGHALRNGDRFEGKVHIRHNEEHAISEYLKKIERAIEE
jgi:hypothetical protein